MQQVKTVSIKGKQYVPVSERVRLVHEEREAFEMLESKPMQLSEQWVWQVVILVDGKRLIGTSEVKLNAAKNTADGTNPWACAETSAVGRALGFAGILSVDSICSAEEVIRAMAEQEAPVRKPLIGSVEPGSITDQQKAALSRLMGAETPDFTDWTQLQASQAIRDLQAELKKTQQRAS